MALSTTVLVAAPRDLHPKALGKLDHADGPTGRATTNVVHQGEQRLFVCLFAERLKMERVRDPSRKKNRI